MKIKNYPRKPGNIEDLQKTLIWNQIYNIRKQEMHKFITAEYGCGCSKTSPCISWPAIFIFFILFYLFNVISPLYHILPSYTIILYRTKIFTHVKKKALPSGYVESILFLDGQSLQMASWKPKPWLLWNKYQIYRKLVVTDHFVEKEPRRNVTSTRDICDVISALRTAED
jgi:hypothetical protein